MQLNLKIHNINHLIKNILGHIEFLFKKQDSRKGELFVINYHGTQKIFIGNFKRQLLFFQKHFQIISPDELDFFYAGNFINSKKPLLLLTFDDGIKNNLNAFEILKELNIKAFFFIIPDFVNASIGNQKNYFIKKIRPIINQNIDSLDEDFQSLTWDDIKKIWNSGNSIGSHSKTHTLVALTSTPEINEAEIITSKEIISNKLNSEINSFCSINNTLLSISSKENKLIKENYKYHFTTIPGFNQYNSNPFFIKRFNIESFWLIGSVKYAIGNWDLFRWKKATKEYQQILSDKK